MSLSITNRDQITDLAEINLWRRGELTMQSTALQFGLIGLTELHELGPKGIRV
jgi:hypothetical protein